MFLASMVSLRTPSEKTHLTQVGACMSTVVFTYAKLIEVLEDVE